MTVWGIVPVKELARSKTRLAAVLSPAGRLALSRQLLERTLHVLRMVPGLAEIAVVSSDPLALEAAQEQGCRPVHEDQPAGLNPALQQASAQALACGAQVAMVVPIDLPLLQPEDVEWVLSLVETPGPGCKRFIVATDRHGKGTNLLAYHLPPGIEFQYGEDSYRMHREQCYSHRLACVTVHHPHLALDLDVPSDLECLSAHHPAGPDICAVAGRHPAGEATS